MGRLLELSPDEPLAAWAMMQMTRRTGDRYRDVSEKLRSRIVEWLKGRDAPEHFVTLVAEGGELDVRSRARRLEKHYRKDSGFFEPRRRKTRRTSRGNCKCKCKLQWKLRCDAKRNLQFAF